MQAVCQGRSRVVLQEALHVFVIVAAQIAPDFFKLEIGVKRIIAQLLFQLVIGIDSAGLQCLFGIDESQSLQHGPPLQGRRRRDGQAGQHGHKENVFDCCDDRVLHWDDLQPRLSLYDCARAATTIP